VQTAADEISAAETDPSIREAAVRWKINSIPAMQAAVFQLDPLAALADAWGLCAQMERFATGAGKDLFGDSQRIAVQDSLTLSEDVAALARSVVGDQVEHRVPRREDQRPMPVTIDAGFLRL